MIFFNLGLLFLLCLFVALLSPPAEVEGLEVVNTAYDRTDISWDESESATSYVIYRSADGGDFEYVTTTQDTSYSDTDVRTGTEYSYAVLSCNVVKSSDPDPKQFISAKPSLERPELKIDVSDGELKLSYSEVDGAIGYEISKDGEVIGYSTENSFVDETIDEAKHDYSVRAYRYKKDPVYSEESNKVNAEMELLNGFDIELFEGDMYITWNKDSYYTNYKVTSGGTVIAETADNKCQLNDYKLDTPYDIKVTGYNSDGTVQSPAIGENFEIIEEEMTNAQAIDDAIAWGIHVANDNSFTYGAGKRAHRYGCYFCQTNVGPRKNIKGKSKVNGHSYEKTYCCNPFAHALYAHGTGDPAMMKACRSGHGIAMTVKSFTRYGHWKNCGKVSKSNLKKGDVLVRSDHVMTYIGNGNIVQASGGGWDAGSIQVTNLGSRKYTFVMRYTGVGRGVHDVIRDFDDDGNLVDEEGNIVREADNVKAGEADAEDNAKATEDDSTKAEETT